MTHLREVETPHESRYHVSKPPENFHAILRKLVKAMRDPAYRRRGGFANGDAIRSEILSVSKVATGDADDISRFLKKHGVLKAEGDEKDPRTVWALAPEAADELYGKCVDAGTAERKDRTFVELCERVSDPGDAPGTNGKGSHDSFPGRTMVSRLAGSTIEEALGNGTIAKVHDFSTFDDELLALHETELRKKIADAQAELEAVTDEQDRREKRRRDEAELKELEAKKVALRRELQSIEERELEIAARASGKTSG